MSAAWMIVTVADMYASPSRTTAPADGSTHDSTGARPWQASRAGSLHCPDSSPDLFATATEGGANDNVQPLVGPATVRDTSSARLRIGLPSKRN